MYIPQQFAELIVRSQQEFHVLQSRSTNQGTSNALGVPGSFPMIVIVCALILLALIVGGYNSMVDRNSS